MRTARPREPIVNLPPVTAAASGVLLAVHLIRQFLPASVDDRLLLEFALIPARLTQHPSLGALATLFTHMLLHGNWMHLAINLAMLVAFGSGAERLLGSRRMLIIALASGLAGGLVHTLVYAGADIPMIGASGAISGLMGAVVLLVSLDRGPREIFFVSALWVVFNVVAGMIGIPGDDSISIAWVAHLGGYAAGLACTAWMLRLRRR